MDVGWLGLGSMGLPMARCVAREHRVTAYDPSPWRAEEVGPDARVATGPAEAASGCEALVVAVASPAQAEEALFGRGGAASTLSAGARLLVLSTLGPDWVRSAAERVPQVLVVDAPVSGGVNRAASGELLVMSAGADVESISLLELLGEVVPVGERTGDGQAMKIVNQVLCGTHLAAAAEALALADSMGLDPAFAWATVRRGAAASFMLEDRGARMVSGEPQVTRSALALFVKDLGLVLDAAHGSGQPLSVTAAARELFAAAAQEGRATQDDSELYAFVRSLQTDLRSGAG